MSPLPNNPTGQSSHSIQGFSSQEYLEKSLRIQSGNLPLVATNRRFRREGWPRDDFSWWHAESFGGAELFCTRKAVGEVIEQIQEPFGLEGAPWRRNVNATLKLVRTMFAPFRRSNVSGGVAADSRVVSFRHVFLGYFNWPSVSHQAFGVLQPILGSRTDDLASFWDDPAPIGAPSGQRVWAIPKSVLEHFSWHGATKKIPWNDLRKLDYEIVAPPADSSQTPPYCLQAREIFVHGGHPVFDYRVMAGGLGFAGALSGDHIRYLPLVNEKTMSYAEIQRPVVPVIQGCGLSLFRNFLGHDNAGKPTVYEDQIRLTFAAADGALMCLKLTRVVIDRLCASFSEAPQSVAAAKIFGN